MCNSTTIPEAAVRLNRLLAGRFDTNTPFTLGRPVTVTRTVRRKNARIALSGRIHALSLWPSAGSVTLLAAPDAGGKRAEHHVFDSLPAAPGGEEVHWRLDALETAVKAAADGYRPAWKVEEEHEIDEPYNQRIRRISNGVRSVYTCTDHEGLGGGREECQVFTDLRDFTLGYALTEFPDTEENTARLLSILGKAWNEARTTAGDGDAGAAFRNALLDLIHDEILSHHEKP